MIKALKGAFEYRVTAATNKNHVSSRSHLIITMVLESKKTIKREKKKSNRKGKTATMNLRSRLNLVDLAGSESLKKDIHGLGNQDISQTRVSETLAINTSLQALARVITALSKAQKHVPYRDSVLTRLLQDSLGGNSVTQMVACVSPCPKDASETLSTMRYAMFARKIKNSVFKEQDPKDMLLETMQKEVTELKMKLAEQRQHEEQMRANLVMMQQRTNEVASAAAQLFTKSASSRSSSTSFLPGRTLSSVGSSSQEGKRMLAKIQFLKATRDASPNKNRQNVDPLNAALNNLRQRRRRNSEMTMRSSTGPAQYKRITWTEGQFQELLPGMFAEDQEEEESNGVQKDQRGTYETIEEGNEDEESKEPPLENQYQNEGQNKHYKSEQGAENGVVALMEGCDTGSEVEEEKGENEEDNYDDDDGKARKGVIDYESSGSVKEKDEDSNSNRYDDIADTTLNEKSSSLGISDRTIYRNLRINTDGVGSSNKNSRRSVSIQYIHLIVISYLLCSLFTRWL